MTGSARSTHTSVWLTQANFKVAALRDHESDSRPDLERSRSHALMHLSFFLRYSRAAANSPVGLSLVNFPPNVKAAAQEKCARSSADQRPPVTRRFDPGHTRTPSCKIGETAAC